MAHGMVRWTPRKVNEAQDPYAAFCEYANQVLGVPYPTQKDKATLRKKADEFFEQYPHCDWHSLCRVVRWMVAHKKRVSRVFMIVDFHRKVWANGQLPELDPVHAEDRRADELVERALEIESDPLWRRRFLLAQSGESKRKVYELWNQEQVMA